MGDYFGALMRSSGLGAAPRGAAMAPGSALRGSVETVAAPAAAQARSAPMAATQTPSRESSATPLAQGRSHPQPAPAAPTSALKPAGTGDGVDPGTGAALAGPITAQADAGTAPTAALQAALGAPLRDTVVRAAMQWVAADPQQARMAAEPHQAAGLAIAVDIDHDAATPSPHAVPRLADPPRLTVAMATAARTPGATQAQQAWPAPLRPSAPRDEPLAISIGAIHLRVEAPSAQTVARAPAPAAPRAIAPPAPQRSSLARRALRRI